MNTERMLNIKKVNPLTPQKPILSSRYLTDRNENHLSARRGSKDAQIYYAMQDQEQKRLKAISNF